jgi:hypothetical protein
MIDAARHADPIVDYIKKLEYFARACFECIQDINDTQKGIQVNYIVDFSLFCPVIFDRPPQGSAPYLYSKKDEMQRILSEAANMKNSHWPAPGSEDTELGVLMGPEVRHGEAEVYARVQA